MSPRPRLRTALGLRRGWLLLIVPGLLGLLLAACSSASDFPDPSSPVATIPWPDYERLVYDFVDQTDAVIGSVTLEVERVDAVYVMRVQFVLDAENVEDAIEVQVNAATLRPLTYERVAVEPGREVRITGTYSEPTAGANDAEAGALVVTSRVLDGDDVDEKTFAVGAFAFDNDSSAWLWRALDFVQDHEVAYRSVNMRAQRSQLVRVRVVGQDLIDVPAGQFLAWQVEATPGIDRQNIWYAVDAPHVLVRWDQQPRSFRLRAIETERPAAAGS